MALSESFDLSDLPDVGINVSAFLGGYQENQSEDGGSQVDPSLITQALPNTLKVYHRVVMYIFTVASVFCNTSILCCFVKFPRMRQQRYALNCSLAVSDLLVGVSNVVTDVWESAGLEGGLCQQEYEATAFYGLLSVFYLTSIVHSVVIGVDRFLAVTFPFWYLAWMTRRAMTAILVSLWLVAVLFMAIILLLWTGGRRTVFGCFVLRIDDVAIYILFTYVLCCVMLSCLYGKIWHLAASQKRKISDQHTTSDSLAQDSSGNKKANRLVTAVLLSYIILYLPSTLYWILQYTVSSVYLLYLSPFARQSIMTTTFINIFIYAKFMEDFKRAFRALFTCTDLQTNGPM